MWCTATAGTPSDGLYVEVKSSDGFNVAGQLVASKIELKGDGTKGIKGDEGEEAEIEGRVTTAVDTNAKTFGVNGQQVLYTDSTEFKDNAVASALMLEVRLQVAGHFNANGQLVADEIEVRAAGDLRMDGDLTSVDTVNKTVTLFGRTIQVNNLTVLNDDRDGAPDSFVLSNLTGQERVSVSAYQSGQILVATRLEVEDASTDPAELKGPVTVTATPSYSIAGIPLNLNGLISPLDGAVLELEGNYTGGQFNVTAAN